MNRGHWSPIMRTAPLAALILVLCCNCSTLGAQTGIGDIASKGCSAAQRAKSDKASVARLLDMKPNEIGEFKWVDLAGDGRCELVMGVSGGPNVSFVWVYWQDHFQALMGEASLKDAIRDLNGDGKKEIIMDSYLDSAGKSAGFEGFHVWPEVYRLQGEQYVPASKDFPGFYDLEILPKLDKEIAETPALQTGAAAALEMERDKILRVLGRDPNAGLERARYWMKSDDPQIVWDAYLVFADIPGHEAEANAAKQAEAQASQRWFANGRNK